MRVARRRPVLPVLVVTLLLASSVFSGVDDELKKTRSQLEKLRKEIDRFEAQIKEKEKREHSTLDLLDTYDRQATLTRKLIKRLHEEERVLQKQIDSTRTSIADLSGQVSFLKRQYARSITTAYKYGRTYDLELLLASRSVNQMLVRAEYLKRFSDRRQRDLERIVTQRTALESQNLLLRQQMEKQQKLIAEKAREEQNLTAKMKKRKQLLADIRKDKKNLKREVDRKRESERQLGMLIAKLIEEERIRKEREAKARGGKAPERDTRIGGTFEQRKGRLRWPVAEGKVVGRFGQQQHPVLQTITQNTGIDIAVPSGTAVSAIADGDVSTIWWLPSFGNLVILNHSNGYRTVYAHLSEISVNEGQRVGEGDQVGRSGEALTGSLLHFELWKDRDKQDPEQWLLPRGLTQR